MIVPTCSLLLTLLALPLASAAHQPSRRRHHNKLKTKDSACNTGDYTCDGSKLKQCDTGGQWVVLQVCSSDTVCSADGGKQANIGCLWPDQVGGKSASASVVYAASSSIYSLEQSWSTSSYDTVAPSTTVAASSTQTGTTHWWDPSTTDASSSGEPSSPTSTDWNSPAATTTTGWGASSAANTGSSTGWGSASSAAVTGTSTATSAAATSTASSTSSSSSDARWVVYSDYPTLDQPPTAAELGNITHFILSFWLISEGAFDNVAQWTALTDAERTSIKADYADNDKYLMVSAFGSTDTPTTSGYDAAATAKRLAAFVIEYDLDGVDIDYEDFASFTLGTAMPWLITFQETLRELLPSPYIISHAPVAPWFTSANTYEDGGYRGIYNSTGDGIDFFNVQFYNQGSTEYTTCNGLLYESSSDYPGSSLFEIADQGIPVEKLVIGKPSDSTQADNGYMTPALLATCLKEAKAEVGSSFPGVMNWQYDANLSLDIFETYLAAL